MDGSTPIDVHAAAAGVQALFLWDRLGFPKIKSDGTSEAEFMQGLCDLVGRGESSKVVAVQTLHTAVT
jgi:hypothetical protein